MKKNIIILLSSLALLSLGGCEDYVSNIEPYMDRLVSDALNTQANVPYFITGVDLQCGFTVDHVLLSGDAMSDQLFFDTRNSLSTYPGWEMLDKADPIDYRDENAAGYRNAHEMRQLADTLVWRTSNMITFTDSTLRSSAFYNGKFYSAYAYFLLATYFGRSQTDGGSPINKGHFVPSAKLYQVAVNRWKEALTYTASAYNVRLINSMMARAYLFSGDYANAALCAGKGLVSPDAPFLAKYNTENDNAYRTAAGEMRDQLMVDPRFIAYINADSTEANRIKIKKMTGTGGWIYYRQVKYIKLPDNTIVPIELMDWQENNLMRAELAVRGQGSDNALTLINQVRSSRKVSVLPANTTITLADPKTATTYSIFEERDKELWVRGARLVDQRRFNKWHLGPGTWQYVTIDRNEKDRNPFWNVE